MEQLRNKASLGICEWLLHLLHLARRGEWKTLWDAAESSLSDKEREQWGSPHNINRQKVVQLAEEGQYSKAVRMLDSCGIRELDGEVTQKLSDKHPVSAPPSPDESAVRVANDLYRSAPQISKEEVLKAIRSFSKGTAPGASAMRAQHLLDAVNDPLIGKDSAFLSLLTNLVNTLAAGKLNAPLMSPAGWRGPRSTP